MQLDTTEQRLLEECRKKQSSWAGWEWCYFGAGVVLLGLGIFNLHLIAAVSNPQAVPEEAKRVSIIYTVVAFLLGLYLLESGAYERRDRKLRGLLLKFADQVGKQP